MQHNGNFETPEGGYGARFILQDGTPVNVMTIFVGPGLAADTEIQAARPLSREEQDAVLDADTRIDHAKEPRIAYDLLPRQHYF